MSNEKDETGKTYAEIWGEAIHSNRHLRVLSMGLAGLCLLLIISSSGCRRLKRPAPSSSAWTR